MRLLDKYINKSIYKIFLITVFTFTILYVMVDVIQDLDEFIDRKIPPAILFQYYLSFFPMILVNTSSMACLISVLFTFSSLHNNNEVIAMRASGLNFWQITKPALYFGLIMCAVVFLMNEKFIPKADQMKRKFRNENIVLEGDRLKKSKESVRNLTFYGLKNRLFYVDTFDPNTNELSGVTIIEYDENTNILQKIIAFKGTWTGIAWKFYECQITSYDKGEVTNPVKVKVYRDKLMDIQESPEDFLRQQIKVTSMNILELKSYIERFSKSGANTAINNLKVDLHHKIASPFGNLVIVLLGLPFALMVKARKGMTFVSFGIAVAIGFLYYVASAVSLAFGKGGLLPPIVSAWLVPVTFGSVAIIMIESNFSN